MTQRLRTLAAKTDNLNLTPSIQMVEGENQLVKVVPDLHIRSVAYTLQHTNVHTMF